MKEGLREAAEASRLEVGQETPPSGDTAVTRSAGPAVIRADLSRGVGAEQKHKARPTLESREVQAQHPRPRSCTRQTDGGCQRAEPAQVGREPLPEGRSSLPEGQT